MAELADTLERTATAYIDHPVVDATGLEGGFDFAMRWTAKALLQSVLQPDGGQAGQASDLNGITVFEALERERGLRLVRQNRVTIGLFWPTIVRKYGASRRHHLLRRRFVNAASSASFRSDTAVKRKFSFSQVISL
jgi:Protein of unknown function (DUF3738)